MLLNLPNKPSFPQLWITRVGESSQRLEISAKSLLTPSEQQRFSRIKQSNKQRQYLLSRWLIRHALSKNFPRQPEDWQIHERAGQQADIINLPYDCHYSLSHSHEWIVLALSSTAVGIDIEKKRPRKNLSAMAEQFMSARELDIFCSDSSETYFYRCWSLKEAVFKSLPADDQVLISLNHIDTTQLSPSQFFEACLADFQLTLFSSEKLTSLTIFELGCHQRSTLLKPLNSNLTFNLRFG